MRCVVLLHIFPTQVAAGGGQASPPPYGPSASPVPLKLALLKQQQKNRSWKANMAGHGAQCKAGQVAQCKQGMRAWLRQCHWQQLPREGLALMPSLLAFIHPWGLIGLTLMWSCLEAAGPGCWVIVPGLALRHVPALSVMECIRLVFRQVVIEMGEMADLELLCKRHDGNVMYIYSLISPSGKLFIFLV